MVSATSWRICRTPAAGTVRVHTLAVYGHSAVGHNRRVNYAELLQSTLRQRLPMHRALAVLRDSGASPAEAAQAVGTLTGYSADDALAVVRQSGAWNVPRGAAADAEALARRDPVGRHGRSGHGAATVLPHLMLPYVVRPGRAGGGQRA